MSCCYAIILTSRAVGGLHWRKNSDNSFTSSGGGKHYSDLDLYLMGMIDKFGVPSMTLIENTGIDSAKLPEPGATITGTARTVTIGDIVAAEGERIPSAADAQKIFKAGFIFITRPDTFTGAETFHFDDLMRLGSEKAVKEAGLLRSEGKEYAVKDGDIMLFRFNV